GDRVLREHRERQLLHGGVPLRADPRDAAGRGVLPGDAASRGAAAVRVRVSAVARGRDVPGGHAGPGHPMAAGGARGRPRGVRRPRDRPVGAGVSPEAGALMLTTFVTRSMVSARPVSIGRVTAVMNRNTTVLRSGAAYWLVLLSGVVEPLLYLLSIGVGVGALIGEITVDGRAMPYAWYVGPAMLASSAMSGALSETTFNFFHKLKYAKTFDAVLATPTRPIEIALGELAWATVRGAFYSAVFLAVMVVMGMATPGRALAAFPAAVLVGVAFGAL